MKMASVPASCREGGHYTGGTSCLLKDRKYIQCTLLYVTFREGDLFMVDILVSSVWHDQICHLSKAGIKHLSRASYIPKLSFSEHQFCERYQYGKQTIASHLTRESRELSLQRVSQQCVVLRYIHRWCDKEGMGISSKNKRSCVLDLLRIARNGWEIQLKA